MAYKSANVIHSLGISAQSGITRVFMNCEKSLKVIRVIIRLHTRRCCILPMSFALQHTQLIPNTSSLLLPSHLNELHLGHTFYIDQLYERMMRTSHSIPAIPTKKRHYGIERGQMPLTLPFVSVIASVCRTHFCRMGHFTVMNFFEFCVVPVVRAGLDGEAMMMLMAMATSTTILKKCCDTPAHIGHVLT